MDKFKARAKIKKHVRTYNEGDQFEATHTLIRYWWNVINAAIFNDALTYPTRVTVRNIKGQKGACYPEGVGNVGLQMNKHFDNKCQFLEVLVHEMVHTHEWQIEEKMSHGKSFFKWKTRINQQLKLPLHRYVLCDK